MTPVILKQRGFQSFDLSNILRTARHDFGGSQHDGNEKGVAAVGNINVPYLETGFKNGDHMSSTRKQDYPANDTKPSGKISSRKNHMQGDITKQNMMQHEMDIYLQVRNLSDGHSAFSKNYSNKKSFAKNHSIEPSPIPKSLKNPNTQKTNFNNKLQIKR